MTNKEQVDAFDNLAKLLNKLADDLEKKKFLTERFLSTEQIRQAAWLAEDHKALAELWEKPPKTGKFITMREASCISENYVERFGPNSGSDPNNHPKTPFGQRLPLFPNIMWLVDAKKLRKITKLRTRQGLEADLIRIYPGINIAERGGSNFTFIFAAQDINEKLIESRDLDEISKAELIDDVSGQKIENASALEEIGTCNPCQRLSGFVIQQSIEQE